MAVRIKGDKERGVEEEGGEKRRILFLGHF